MYDDNNIFARILRDEIPAKKVLETDHSLAFHDAFPKASTHILIIPKKPYINFHSFMSNATADEIFDFHNTVHEIIKVQQLGEKGYKLLVNTGDDGGQEVPHYHMHVIGGEPLRPSAQLI